MSHTNTIRMIDYWSARKGAALAPSRTQVDPADFSDVITQTFMVGRVRAGAYPFRLAGGLLEDLHRRSLLGSDFLELWSMGDRARIQTAIEASVHRGDGLLADVKARTLHGLECRLELFMAPLLNPTGQIDRLLGLYQPVSPLFKLQNHPLERLFLQDIAFVGAGVGADETVPAPLRIAAVDGRRIA